MDYIIKNRSTGWIDYMRMGLLVLAAIDGKKVVYVTPHGCAGKVKAKVRKYIELLGVEITEVGSTWKIGQGSIAFHGV